MTDTDKVESMTAIVVGSPVFGAQVIGIRGKENIPRASSMDFENVYCPRRSNLFLRVVCKEKVRL